MPNITLTPNMNLPNPNPGIDPGPDYANNLYASLVLVDQHNHSPGYGIAIQPNGLNISSDLTFNSNNAINLRSLRLSVNNSNLSNPSDINCVYDFNGNLWFNDGNANQVQITNNGSLSASTSFIRNGLNQVSFSANNLFILSNYTNNTPANVFSGSIGIGNTTPSPNFATLQAPNSLAANYSLTLPTALPGATSLVKSDSSGNLGYSTPDNSTIAFSGSNLIVPNGGITRTQQAAVGQQISASCGIFSTSSGGNNPVTNLSVTLTTSGRPVFIALQPDGSGTANGSYISIVGSGSPSQYGTIVVTRNGTPISESLAIQQTDTRGNYPLPGFLYLDTPTAGTYTYVVTMGISSGPVTVSMFYAVMVAYEL